MVNRSTSARFRRAITYGTFDLFHFGHLQLFRRIREIADELIVAVATDEFNAQKGKQAVVPFEHRVEIIRELRLVEHVIPEISWDQKPADIIHHDVDLFVMGDDWKGQFDYLGDYCTVLYLPRTQGISSSAIREAVHVLRSEQLVQLKTSLDLLSQVLAVFDE